MPAISSTLEPAAIATLSAGGPSATNSEPTCGNDQVEGVESLAIAVSLFNEVPDDVIIHILLWLEMNDMINASQVSTRWRQIALSTASLWWDVQLTDLSGTSINRCATIISRAKEIPINVKIAVETTYLPVYYLNKLRPTVLRFLQPSGDDHHIRSLELGLNTVGYVCCGLPCIFTILSIFQAAVNSGRQAGMVDEGLRRHGAYVHFPDVRAMRTVKLRCGIFPCALRFTTVTDVQLLDFSSVTVDTLERVCTVFPNITSLSITANEVPYFGQYHAPEHFFEYMSCLERLSVVTKSFNSGAAPIARILYWPVRKIKLDVSGSANGFARQVRKILRELLTSETALIIRSTRQRNATGTWTPKYFVTVRVGSGAGREFTFVHGSFTRVLQNYIAPLLREKQVQEVVVDGHAACALFYAASNTADFTHVKTLRVVAGDPSSIRSPQRQLRLLGLKELILEKDPMRGSRVTAAIVEDLVSKLVTDERVSLRIKDAFVYADAGQHNIEQYVNLVEGVVRSPSWCHIASSV